MLSDFLAIDVKRVPLLSAVLGKGRKYEQQVCSSQIWSISFCIGIFVLMFRVNHLHKQAAALALMNSDLENELSQFQVFAHLRTEQV